MKSYFKVALVAILALLPCASSFAALSPDVSTAVTNLATAADKVAAKAQLVAALKAQMRAEGIGSVSDISADLLALATDDESAADFAVVLAEAALDTFGSEGLAAVREGISTSNLVTATVALTAIADADAPTVNSGEPGGDASITPSVDASDSTGVGQ